jgi:hypothetical protein
MKKLLTTTLLSSVLVLSACNSTSYKEVANISILNVSFADSKWNGKTIPSGQHCKYFGGNGATPKLQVSNIPGSANAVIVEFSDETYTPMDNGGHGKIGIWTGGKSGITIPSVMGETTSVPQNIFIEAKHKGLKRGRAGAYLPPCSGGRGNTYYATIKAVYKAKNNKEESQLLGKSKIILGKY